MGASLKEPLLILPRWIRGGKTLIHQKWIICRFFFNNPSLTHCWNIKTQFPTEDVNKLPLHGVNVPVIPLLDFHDTAGAGHDGQANVFSPPNYVRQSANIVRPPAKGLLLSQCPALTRGTLGMPS